jgi:hypothetical protein
MTPDLVLICCAVLSPAWHAVPLPKINPTAAPTAPFCFLLSTPLRNVMLTPTTNQPQTRLRFCYVSDPHKGTLMSINPSPNYSLGYLLTCRYLLLRMPAIKRLTHRAALCTMGAEGKLTHI